ncbi:MAG: diguanylate cyclase [Spirochaetales bacterium]|nr:diguanylate cyclase [Leptospiraceae bacterium]MCP5483403.1 diguanylate cyclase [Spirochaetales bacterium]MCP5486764.1 diguanylate cyclase [Spirochaetales bacterium]
MWIASQETENFKHEASTVLFYSLTKSRDLGRHVRAAVNAGGHQEMIPVQSVAELEDFLKLHERSGAGWCAILAAEVGDRKEIEDIRNCCERVRAPGPIASVLMIAQDLADMAFTSCNEPGQDFITLPLVEAELSQRLRQAEEWTRLSLEIMRLNRDLTKSLRAGVGLKVPGPPAIGTDLEFRSFLDSEWKRCLRYDWPISIVLARIDRLDEFARKRSPGAVERLVADLAGKIQEAVHRPGDLFATLDHFTLPTFGAVLSETNASGARHVGQRILRRVDSAKIDLGGGLFRRQRLSISVGVATVRPLQTYRPLQRSPKMPQIDATQKILVEMAESALGKAIEQGGHRVVCLPEPDEDS